ncbi:MAG: cob(I)yrinic acid a,c-diamide adenosyltransferase [Alphaproteobacteria bacterium]|nr:cob(I)yrinic acid a,c-diamide adenosyltransferase [Alphaproteobacteria bacterium]
MVKLNKIYTRTGDDGSTGLGDGTRRQKDDLRVEAYGTVDEANSCISLLLAAVRQSKQLSAAKQEAMEKILVALQHDLFDLGADLSKPFHHKSEAADLRIIESQVTWLENVIDEWNSDLAPLASFVLPSGGWAASFCHLARTVVRRAERLVVALNSLEKINAHSLHYLNRLSDLLFVFARALAIAEGGEVLWQPGKNR